MLNENHRNSFEAPDWVTKGNRVVFALHMRTKEEATKLAELLKTGII
ncbi:MAG: hypothetical protein ACYDIA_22900 [Candidatus Humimicrobiaceae bacterium]